MTAASAYIEPEARRQTTPSERQMGFRLLFLCLMCTGIGQSIIFTLLPPLARRLHLTETETGGIFLASGLIWVFASPWWGKRSDIWGRKPIILIGLLGYALSMSCFASALLAGVAGWIYGPMMYFTLMAARSIYGILSSGTFPAAQAYVADRTTEEERTGGVSALSAAFGLGATIGPGLGAALVGLVAAIPSVLDAITAYFGRQETMEPGFREGMTELSLVAPLYAVSLLALIVGSLILIYLPERTKPIGNLRRARLRVSDGRIIPHVLVGIAISLAQGIQAQTVNFYFMDTLHLPIESAVGMVGVALTTSAFAAFTTQFFVVQRYNLTVNQLLIWGGALAVIGYLLFLATNEYATMVLGLILASIGMSLMRPGNAAAASLAVSEAEQGSVAGLTGATAALGFVVGPIISLPLYGFNHAIPFWICVGVTALAWVYCVLHGRVRGLDSQLPPDDPNSDLHRV